MSNVPSGQWPPSPPAYHPNPPGVANSPATSAGWRIRHSLWLLLPILGSSCIGGFGFLYVGLRARRRAWWIAGIVYVLVGWTTFFLVGGPEERSLLTDLAVTVMLMAWFGSSIHAVAINPSWLRWRATYRTWYAQPAPGPAGSQPPLAPPPTLSTPAAPVPPAYGPAYPAPNPAPSFAPPLDTYYGPGPAAAPVPPPAARPVPPPTPGTAARVDINTAGLDQLAALPGFDTSRAQNVLAERARRGGFGSVAEFAAVAGLAPHEYAPLRDLLVCSPPPGPYGGPPPQGRVVDV